MLHQAFSTKASNDNLNTAGVFPQRCENMTGHWVQCCGCPDGCSVASLLNPPPDMLVDGGPVQMLLYVRAHTANRTRNWQSALSPHLTLPPPSSLPTCDSTCVSICRVEMPVVLVRSQCASSTFSEPPSISLSAVCPPH